MTNLEKEALNVLAKRINELTRLDNASFNMNKDKDEEVKRAIRPYMQWFMGVASDIEKVVELADDKQDFIKRKQLEEIIRLNL